MNRGKKKKDNKAKKKEKENILTNQDHNEDI